jgi:hypothetical protein
MKGNDYLPNHNYHRIGPDPNYPSYPKLDTATELEGNGWAQRRIDAGLESSAGPAERVDR